MIQPTGAFAFTDNTTVKDVKRMFNVVGTQIELSRGDTGAIDFTATGYTFGTDDRALFSVKDRNGTVVKQQAYAMTNNAFTVTFYNADTDALPAGNYTWDVRYVINPLYDDNDYIVDGDQVITPMLPQPLRLLIVFGEI